MVLLQLGITDLQFYFTEVQQAEVRQFESNVQAVVLPCRDWVMEEAQCTQRLNISKRIKVCQFLNQVSSQYQRF